MRRGIILIALAGCGLDAVGTAAVGAPDAQTPSAVDATTSASSGTNDAPPKACACELAPPDGFTLVAFAANRSAACGGDLTTEDLVSAGSAACTCAACTVTTMPSCTASTFTTSYDLSSTAQCESASTISHSTNGCVNDSGNLGSHVRVSTPAVSGGACTSTPVPDKASLATVRVCSATKSTCACDAGPAFTTCIRHPGDVECPTAAPKKTLVAGDADIACGACSCTITNAACKATVNWYSDSNCDTVRVTSDSAHCGDAPGGSYSSVRWSATPSASCSAPATTTGTATLRSPDTICCP